MTKLWCKAPLANVFLPGLGVPRLGRRRRLYCIATVPAGRFDPVVSIDMHIVEGGRPTAVLHVAVSLRSNWHAWKEPTRINGNAERYRLAGSSSAELGCAFVSARVRCTATHQPESICATGKCNFSPRRTRIFSRIHLFTSFCFRKLHSQRQKSKRVDRLT